MEEQKDFTQIDLFNKIHQKYVSEIESIKDHRLKAELINFIENVPFVYNLVRADRKKANELPKDSKGRITVSLTEPHILEDTDYFRAAALHFQKHNCYTQLYPSSAPGSDYRTFWDEEIRRCLEGYTRESDGEWITGEHYWYLNYCPIQIAESKKKAEGFENVEATRTEDFPLFHDGDYIYFHYRDQARKKGLHCAVLKTRGRGYSFKAAAVLSRPFYHMRGQKMYAMASEGEYLYTDGVLNDKTWNILNFIDVKTPWTQPREYKDKPDHKRASYKDDETKTEQGRLNEIIGVTLKNSPQKARGKRGREILWEEFGNFPEGLTSWTIAKGSMRQGRKVFGLMTAFGTGGTAGPAFEAMETLFYKPDSYEVFSLPNVFDRNSEKSSCGLYIGEYLNREFCYDKDGNSDPIKALEEVMNEWKSQDPTSIAQHKADYSVTPQDACLRKEGTLYPVIDLKDYLAEITPKLSQFISGHSVGRLITTGSTVKWNIEPMDIPIREFPLKDNKRIGAIEIFQHPAKSADGHIPFRRYIAGIDPYDHDDSTTTSLGSIFVMDRFTDEIVCEYTGRPSANEFYENCWRILEYYNAIANYENFNKGLFSYFERKNALYRLCDTPRVLTQMEYVRGEPQGNKKKGTPPGGAINAWSRHLNAQWLLQRALRQDELEEGKETNYQNLHKLRSIGLIKELINWNIDGNFDRERALGMLMILREDMLKLGTEEDTTPSFSANNFWVRNYKPLQQKIAFNAIKQNTLFSNKNN